MNSTFGFIDGTSLLVGLQQANAIAKRISGCFEPEAIARQVTDGLVETFGCAFARIWLVEPDRTELRLVASSGLYTRIDGSFARVPMGAFKVGKIAQNQISFLSNQLAEEPWVKDRAWAIAHQIQGFAGYPLVSADQAIGVLAVFSQHIMAPEFLEVLQSLCATTSIALEAALHYQQKQQTWQATQIDQATHLTGLTSLSEQLAQTLKTHQLTLVGTERSLNPALTMLILGAAEVFSQFHCLYSRLTYATEQIDLELMMSNPADLNRLAFAETEFAAVCLGGSLQIQTEAHPGILQVVLTLPYAHPSSDPAIVVQCRSPILQLALTRLTYLAGFRVAAIANPNLVVVTDHPQLVATTQVVLWVDTGTPIPPTIKGKIDLGISVPAFRQAIETVQQGEFWGMVAVEPTSTLLSDREREIITLMTQGLRDRDIANRLIISESTVKFHMNNVLTKLNARTRFQALHQVISKGWLD